MKRIPLYLALIVSGMLFIGADGCSGDPNVEGAKLHMNNKDYDQAIVNLDKALEKNPDNGQAWAMKADALREKAFMTGDVEEHSRMVREMADAIEKAGSLGEDVTIQRNNGYYKEFERGVLAFNAGANNNDKFKDAARYFDNTSYIIPDSSGPYIYKGYSLLRLDDSQGAIDAIETGIEKGVEEVDPYIYLGELYKTADRSADRVALFEAANERFPEDADVQAHLLNSYQMAGMMDRAREKYTEGLAKDPNNTTFLYNLGSLLLGDGDYDGAVVHLEKATKLDPTYSNAWYNLGAAYQNKAVGINERITAVDDSIRANRANMTPEQIRAGEAEIDKLAAERKATFGKAINPLEQSKKLVEANGGDVTRVCVALYTAYVQTDQLDKAQSVSACAGFDE